MEALSGLVVPTWLVLLARGLDTFSNLAYPSDTAASGIVPVSYPVGHVKA